MDNMIENRGVCDVTFPMKFNSDLYLLSWHKIGSLNYAIILYIIIFLAFQCNERRSKITHDNMKIKF